MNLFQNSFSFQSFYNPKDSFVFTFDGLKKIDAVNVSFDKKQKEINVLIDSDNKIYQYLLNFDRFKKEILLLKYQKISILNQNQNQNPF